MKELFDIESSQLGSGPVKICWGCQGSVLSAAGVKRQIVLFNKEGRETHSFSVGGIASTVASHAKTCANDMQWSPRGVNVPEMLVRKTCHDLCDLRRQDGLYIMLLLC
jgi:hypothetical protein